MKEDLRHNDPHKNYFFLQLYVHMNECLVLLRYKSAISSKNANRNYRCLNRQSNTKFINNSNSLLKN